MKKIDFSDPVFQDFLEDTIETLEKLDQDMMTLEKSPENPAPDLINEIFRWIHSIKGNAGFVGLSKIRELAHAMENVFGEIRCGNIHLSSEMVNPIFNGLDKLKYLIGDIENSESSDIADLAATINDCIKITPPRADTVSESIQEIDLEKISFEPADDDANDEPPIDFSDELIFDFQEEALEALEVLDRDFLTLEAHLDSPKPDLINRIFREVHTVKGTAGFFNLTKIQKLAHAMENIFDDVRKDKFQISVQFMNVLFQGLDTLKGMITDLESSQSINISELISILNRTSGIEEQPAGPLTVKKNDAVEEKIIPSVSAWDSLVKRIEQTPTFPDCYDCVRAILDDESYEIDQFAWTALCTGSSGEKIIATEFFSQTQERLVIPHLIVNSKSSDSAVRFASFRGLDAISIAEVGYTCIHGLNDDDAQVRALVLKIVEKNVSPLISGIFKRMLEDSQFNGKLSSTLGEVPIPDILFNLKENPECIRKISQIVFKKGTETMVDDYWKKSKFGMDADIQTIWDKAGIKVHD